MDNKTYEYMKRRTDKFKSINDKITIANKRIEFYKNKQMKKYFGQTNNSINSDNLGKEFIEKLTQLTIIALEEEKQNLQTKLEEI